MGIIDVIDAVNTVESNTTYITLSFDEKIKMIIDMVYQCRYNEAVKKLKKRASFVIQFRTLKDVHYTENRLITKDLVSLATCSFMNLNTNLVIHGPCGTGKAWLTCAALMRAIKQKDIRHLYIRLRDYLNYMITQRNSGKEPIPGSAEVYPSRNF